MPLESSDTQHSTAASANSVAEIACAASTASEQFGGKGWIEFDNMANKLAWRHSRLTAVLRWLRQQSPDYVVESKISSGVVKIRITKVDSDAKLAKQLSAEIISQLAKLYSNLKHSDRNREKLACDVRTIASRIAPFLENREFQVQCRRFKRQLVDKQQESSMEVSADTPASPLGGDLANAVSANAASTATPSSLDDLRATGFDQLALRRLVLIGSIIVAGLLVTIVLATTFLHAMEQLSHYVERINAQLEL